MPQDLRWPLAIVLVLLAACGAEARKSGGTQPTDEDDAGAGGGGAGLGGKAGGSGGANGAAGQAGGGQGGQTGTGGGTGGGGGAAGSAGTSGIADAGADKPPSGEAGVPTPVGQFAVVTNRYDNLRTGSNPNEKILTVAKVGAPDAFGLLFSRQYDGNPYGQPLFVPGLMIKGAVHNVVFIVTSTNNVYAFDADDPAAVMPLWTRQLAPPADVKTDGATVKGNGHTICLDMFPFVGITSTPVIDVAKNRMYVVSKEGKVDMPYFNKLHAIDLLTGAETPGSPVTMDASVPGTGAGAVNGMVKLDGWKHMVRPGLLLHKGALYIGVGSHCDDNPYHGWVLSYDPDTLKLNSAFNTSPNGIRGAVWQSGVGLAANDNGIYFTTGNGDSTPDGKALSLSVVRLNANNTLGDWFTPSNVVSLNSGDQDLTGGVLLIPNSNNLVASGKECVIYLMNQLNMTHFNAKDAITQEVAVPKGTLPEIHNLTYWNSRLYVWPDNTGLRVYVYANGKLGNTPAATYDGRMPGHPGGTLVVSSNGETPGTGILWAAVTTNGDSWHSIARGGLVALDAMNPTMPLWDSTINSTRDNLGNLAKFSPPTVANGKVYVNSFATANASSPAFLRVYGLLK